MSKYYNILKVKVSRIGKKRDRDVNVRSSSFERGLVCNCRQSPKSLLHFCGFSHRLLININNNKVRT